MILLPSQAMNTADGPPPVPVVPGQPLPASQAPVFVVTESRVTKVARVFAIVRDVVIITVIVLVLFAASEIMRGIQDVRDIQDGGPGVLDPVPTCVGQSTDQWGTFCPETPGG